MTPSRLPEPVLDAAIRTAGQAARALGLTSGPIHTAMAVPGITGLTITIPVGQRVLPLPDGDRYLGFIFAEAGTRREVEQALTAARDRLRVVIT